MHALVLDIAYTLQEPSVTWDTWSFRSLAAPSLDGSKCAQASVQSSSSSECQEEQACAVVGTEGLCSLHPCGLKPRLYFLCWQFDLPSDHRDEHLYYRLMQNLLNPASETPQLEDRHTLAPSQNYVLFLVLPIPVADRDCSDLA